MTIHMGDTYFVVVHWHIWPTLLMAVAAIAIGCFWKLRKR